jgi:Kef-type K+ transport system membrane component KefB
MSRGKVIVTEPQMFLIIFTLAVAAPILAEWIPRVSPPSVVVEIICGILIGPHMLGWVQVRPDSTLDVLSRFGMAFLFFLAGLEIDFKAIKGRPLTATSLGWLVSLVLALGLGWSLEAAGMVDSGVVVAVALTTTALGTLIPILRDSGVSETKFGSFVVAAGAAGEFGPIILLSVVLTGSHGGATGGFGQGSGILLLIFTLITILGAYVSARIRPAYVSDLFDRKLHTSAQLPVRVALLLLIALVILTHRWGLDHVLGAIAAGVVVSLACQGHKGEIVKQKLEGIGFGFFVPIFFIVNGVKFNLAALGESPLILIQVPLFLLLFLVVRGVPALLCRRDLPRGDLLPLALFSATALPLVVAVTEVGVKANKMSEATAVALVGAGMVSVLLFPLLALILRKAAVPATPVPVTPQALESEEEPESKDVTYKETP